MSHKRLTISGIVLFIVAMITTNLWHRSDDSKFFKSTRESQIRNLSSDLGEEPSSQLSSLDFDKRQKNIVRLQGEAQELSRREKCHERIQSQTEHSSDYLRRHQKVWKQLVGNWYFEKKLPDENPGELNFENMFLLALVKGGSLDGIETKNKDLLVAIQLLEQAHLQDPKNSAILVFMAYFQGQLGLKEQEKLSLEKINKTQVYDTYLSSIVQEVYRSIVTPSDLINAISIVSQIPVPKYNKKFLQYIVENKISRVGEQMLFTRYETKSPDFSTPLNVFVGRHLLSKIDPLRSDLPSKESLKAKFNTDLYGDHSMFFDEVEDACDLDWYWPATQKFREMYAQE